MDVLRRVMNHDVHNTATADAHTEFEIEMSRVSSKKKLPQRAAPVLSSYQDPGRVKPTDGQTGIMNLLHGTGNLHDIRPYCALRERGRKCLNGHGRTRLKTWNFRLEMSVGKRFRPRVIRVHNDHSCKA